MEWGILFSVVTIYGLRMYGFANEYLKKSEPQGPFVRPSRTIGATLRTVPAEELRGRLRGETSMNDMTAHLWLGVGDDEIDRFIATLRENNEYNEALKRGLIPEKVNWKEEGF